METNKHAVYVIYYEGEPCRGVNKPAYLTVGTANKVISDRAWSTVRWSIRKGDEGYEVACYEEERAKYSIEKYTREVVSGDA